MFLNALTRGLALAGTFAAHPVVRAEHLPHFGAKPPIGDPSGTVYHAPPSVVKNIDTIADVPSLSQAPAFACPVSNAALTPAQPQLSEGIQAAIGRALNKVEKSAEPMRRPDADIKPSEMSASLSEHEQLQQFSALDPSALEVVLARTLRTEPLGRGAFASTYAIPDYPELVLRANHEAEENIKTHEAGGMCFTPISYTGLRRFITKEPNLCAPHGVLTNDAEDRFKPDFLDPKDALLGFNKPRNPEDTVLADIYAKYPQYAILPNCKGRNLDQIVSVPQPHFTIGFLDDEYTSMGTQLHHLHEIEQTRALNPEEKLTAAALTEARADREAAQKLKEMYFEHTSSVNDPAADATFAEPFLQACANGKVTEQASILTGGKAFHPRAQKLFFATYEAFVRKYQENVEAVAAIPQASFNAAIAALAKADQARDVLTFDAQHSKNLNFDLESKQFKFVDLGFGEFNDYDFSATRGADFVRFLSTLFPRSSNAFGWQNIHRATDIATLRPAVQQIIDKVQSAVANEELAWHSYSAEYLEHVAQRFGVNVPSCSRFPGLTPDEAFMRQWGDFLKIDDAALARD